MIATGYTSPRREGEGRDPPPQHPMTAMARLERDQMLHNKTQEQQYKRVNKPDRAYHSKMMQPSKRTPKKEGTDIKGKRARERKEIRRGGEKSCEHQ